MKQSYKNNENGNIVLFGILFILIGTLLAFAGLRVYETIQNENENEVQNTEIADQTNSDNEYTEQKQVAESINDGGLEISDTGLDVIYDTSKWSASDNDGIYDYVLTSNTSFKLSIDVIDPDEGGKGCGDCIYEQLDTVVIENNTYYLSVAGGYSSADNQASNVTLSASPTELVLPILADGRQLFYQLTYFPGSPETLSLRNADFQEAIAVMKTISN